jgi:hypothetical protein
LLTLDLNNGLEHIERQARFHIPAIEQGRAARRVSGRRIEIYPANGTGQPGTTTTGHRA